MIGIGSDHVGFELKEEIKKFLKEKGINYKDYGCYSPERTDYPIYAEKVAKAIISGECEKGILICGTGIGMSIAANKFKGIRAAVCSDCYSAKMSRLHNNANILALGSRVVGLELAKTIVEVWLYSEYEGGRHQKRLDLISQFESSIQQS